MSKELIPAMEGELLIYPAGEGNRGIRVLLSGETVWLTQAQMGELFQTSKQNIAKHLKAIFSERELEAGSVVNQWLTTAADGKACHASNALSALSGKATVKQSLTTAEDFSVVQAHVASSARMTPRS